MNTVHEYRTLHVLVKRRQGSRDTHGTHKGHTYRYRRKDTWGSRDTHEHWSTRAHTDTSLQTSPSFHCTSAPCTPQRCQHGATPTPTVIRPPSRAELNELDDIRAPAPLLICSWSAELYLTGAPALRPYRGGA